MNIDVHCGAELISMACGLDFIKDQIDKGTFLNTFRHERQGPFAVFSVQVQKPLEAATVAPLTAATPLSTAGHAKDCNTVVSDTDAAPSTHSRRTSMIVSPPAGIVTPTAGSSTSPAQALRTHRQHTYNMKDGPVQLFWAREKLAGVSWMGHPAANYMPAADFKAKMPWLYEAFVNVCYSAARRYFSGNGQLLSMIQRKHVEADLAE